ncbi:MAG: hypothetical protein HFJ38_06290 [Bacilli bacterium]|nr:hypothetical protein [Bacilli bacterium]
MKFFRSKDNKEYLIIQLQEYLEYIYFYGQPKVEEELQYKKMIRTISNCNFSMDSQIAIHKNSLLGQFVLENVDGVRIIDEDCKITEEKIRNAILIAIYDNVDFKLLNKLETIFRDGKRGSIVELEKMGYNRDILKQIAETEDIDTHIKKKNNEYIPKNFIVFENREIMYKNLLNGDYQYKKELK